VGHLGPEFGGQYDLGLGPPEVMPGGDSPGDLKEATRAFQRALIGRTLAAHHGNWAAAARALGMHRSNLHHLAVRLGLK